MKKSSNQSSLFQHLYRLIQQFLSGRSYLPLSQKELQARLQIPEEQQSTFKEVLLDLLEKGEAQIEEGRYKISEQSTQIATGTLRVHPRGFGFLQPNNPILFPKDIFIPKHLTKHAVDGDLVEVLVDNSSFSEKGPEGKVTAILKRGRTHVAGTIQRIEEPEIYIAYVPLLGTSKKVVVHPKDDYPIKVGDRFVLKVLDWGGESQPTYCEVSHYLGHISDASCDVKAAIEEFELRNDFPSRAIKEAASFGNKVLPSEIKHREDLRAVECFTIDPDTAKDFDDALSLHQDEKGHYHLGVHIADVSHYIKEGSALDQEAKLRCNSTYFPTFCLPMLPHELSSELCSLKPNVNRLTVSVFIELDPQGALVNHRIARSVIKSAKRFTYKEAKLVLDGKRKSKHAPTLHLMVELCGLLKKQRHERGSIEFSLGDLIILVDDKGEPYGTERVEYDITHQLVEEFMLKANETVATHLSQKGEGLAYRVHEEPSEDNMKEFCALARAFGFNLPHPTTTKDLQNLFDEAKTTPYSTQLATSFIRSMKLAYYSPVNEGHYGLSLEYYCHFTSPIRRYIDLVVHRILCEGPQQELESLKAMAHTCSEQERISARAEASVLILKKLRLLQKMFQEDPTRSYPALVTRVKNAGILFEIPAFTLEGFLHISELDNDYFIYDERRLSLTGKETHISYTCGAPIQVQLTSLNFITLESSWALVTDSPRSKKKKIKHRTRRKKQSSDE